MDWYGEMNRINFIYIYFLKLIKTQMSDRRLSQKMPVDDSIYEIEEATRWFRNPVSKNTFEALPRIYGSRKKKKYMMKQYYQSLTQQKDGQVTSKEIGNLQNELTQDVETNRKNQGQSMVKSRHRFQTEMKSYLKRSTERLSLPKEEFCNKRYCFCNRKHTYCSSQKQLTKKEFNKKEGNKKNITIRNKSRPNKLVPLRVKQSYEQDEKLTERSQPEQVQTRHKVMSIGVKSTSHANSEANHLSLLQFLRSNQEKKNADVFKEKKQSKKQSKKETPRKKVSVEIQHPAQLNTISVQTQNYQIENALESKGKNKHKTESEEIQDMTLLRGKTQDLDKYLPERHSKKISSSIEHRPEFNSSKKLKHSSKEKFHSDKEDEQKEKEILSKPKSSARDVQNDAGQKHQYQHPQQPQLTAQEHHFKLQKLRAKYKQKQMVDSDEDDAKSLVSSISSASISKYVFDRDKQSNTMFHTLTKKQSSGVRSSKMSKKSSKQGQTHEKAKFQKKNGLFVIPEEDQYVDYLKNYKPIHQKFAIKKLVRKQNFKVVPSEDGIYFGQYVDSKKEGKGLMVTQKTIYEGKYHEDQKTFGCEKNIDGVYKGQFVKGVRQGYGTFEWYNGQIFEGQWKNGTKNGFGVWRSPKGDFYEGNWLLNRQNGKGTFQHRLSTFRGYFVNFLKQGEGEQIFANGDKYVGSYKQGKPHGKGKYQWSDGSYYEGQFVNGLRQGKGKWAYKNGTVYQGEFKNDFKDGYGVQRYKSGQIFEGIFKEGNKYEGNLFDLQKNVIKIKNQE